MIVAIGQSQIPKKGVHLIFVKKRILPRAKHSGDSLLFSIPSYLPNALPLQVFIPYQIAGFTF